MLCDRVEGTCLSIEPALKGKPVGYILNGYIINMRFCQEEAIPKIGRDVRGVVSENGI